MFFKRLRTMRKIKKYECDGFSFYTLCCNAMSDSKDNTYTGGKTRLMTNYALESQEMLERMQKECPKVKTSAEIAEEYREKYQFIELRNCPLCNYSASLTIYPYNYDFKSGFPGGYDIYAIIHCKKCSCGLDKIKLETNIHPVECDIDELIKDYAQKWNTRYDDSSDIKAPGELYFKSGMKFKEDNQNE